MSTWPLVKFVESPTVGAVVRFDCNDLNAAAPRRVAELDLGVPTLEGDPDAVGQQWGFRSPSILQRIKGTKAQALAALQALSREQLRRTNWVMVQLSADTQPRFLKTYRTGYESLSLERVDVDRTSGLQGRTPDTWEFRVPLLAEAFAYGPRVTHATATFTQTNAVTGSSTLRVILPTIKGDAPAPLRVNVTPVVVGATPKSDQGSSWLLACINGTTAMAPTIVDIGLSDGHTAGSGTAAGTSDSTYFGNSYRTVTIGSGANQLERLSGSIPALPRGRYKVLLRAQLDTVVGTAKPFSFAFGQRPSVAGDTPLYGTSVKVTAGYTGMASSDPWQGFVDLGDFTFPRGATVSDDVADTTDPTLFSIKIGTLDGSSATVRMDSLLLIPIYGRTVDSAWMLQSQFGTSDNVTDVPQLAGNFTGTFDGDDELFWLNSTATGALRSGGVSLRGSFPVADPGQARTDLYLIAMDKGADTAAVGAITAKGAAADVVVSYHPRYLYLGDGT